MCIKKETPLSSTLLEGKRVKYNENLMVFLEKKRMMQ